MSLERIGRRDRLGIGASFRRKRRGDFTVGQHSAVLVPHVTGLLSPGRKSFWLDRRRPKPNGT